MSNSHMPRKHGARMNAATRKEFLSALSETANVSRSARLAGLGSSAVYAERRRSSTFRADWSVALAEGYARLESDMLAEALQAADGKISDAMLKARAQKHRLRLGLLSVHRANAKAITEMPVRRSTADLAILKAQLILKLTQMRERAGISLEGKKPDGDA